MLSDLRCFFLWLGSVPVLVAEVCDDFLPSQKLPSTPAFFPPSPFRASSLCPCDNIGMPQSLSEVPRRPSLSVRTTEDGCYLKSQGDDVPSVLERLASFPTALPVSLQLSLLHAAFAMPSRCSPLKFFVPGASLLSLELPSLPRSFAVFRGVPQSSPEFLLVHQSCCYFLGAPFPRSSSEILREASPVFGELSCCLL